MINSREVDTHEFKKVILCSSQLANAELDILLIGKNDFSLKRIQCL